MDAQGRPEESRPRHTESHGVAATVAQAVNPLSRKTEGPRALLGAPA